MEEPNTIRMGFRNVRGVREHDVLEMVEQRKQKQFETIEDFIARTNFDKAVLSHLAISDSFKEFGLDRRHSFWKSLEFKNLTGKGNGLQLSLFDENIQIEQTEPIFNKMSDLESATVDYQTLGYSLNGSLMKHLRLELPHLPPTNSKLLKRIPKNRTVSIAGILLVDQRPPPAKGFGFITLEDEFGTIDLVLRPDVYDKFKLIFRSSRFLVVTGRIQRLDEQVTILAETIENFSNSSNVRGHQPHPRMLNRLQWG